MLGLQFEQNIGASHTANLALPPWFSNLLPEGPLRSWVADARGVSPDREMELLAQVGADLPGAVRVLPATETADGDLDAREEALPVSAALTDDGTPQWRFSLAGVALKFSMLRSQDRFTCTASGDGGDWIVKVPDAVHANVPLNEFTMMRLAAGAGIEVPDVLMIHRDEIENLPRRAWLSDEEYAFAVRRFDRDHHRGRVHIEDLAQVRGAYARDKFAGNYETVASLIYRGHDEAALTEFVRRLTYFVLIGNGDAHLKNWSLIYRDRRRPTLSPVYDVVSTAVYNPDGESSERLALKFAGSKRFETIRMSQFERLAHRLGAGTDLAGIAADTVRRTVEAWPRFAESFDAADPIRTYIDDSVRRRAATMLQSR